MKSYIYTAILLLFGTSLGFAQPCDFSFAPIAPQCAGADITFTALAVPDSNAQYFWDFGDSTASDTGLSVIHAFPIDTIDQTYTVTLTVVDSNGSCTQSYPITALGAPDLQIMGITDLCLPNLNCNDPFTPPPYSLSSNSGVLSNMGPFTWNWGDGSPPVDTTATTLTHTFQQFGTYNLRVTANGAGCPSVRQRIKFYREPDQPLLTLPIADACEGDTVVATIAHNQCPGNEEIYLVFWDFPSLEDVDTLYAPGQVKHVYEFEASRACNTFAGSISPEVRVWVINPCFPADESINASWNATSAQVDVAPHPLFTVPDDPLCWPDDSVFCFDNNSCPNLLLDSLSYMWTFGDSLSPNNTSTEETPCHTFSGPGVYQVTLDAANTGCGARSLTQTIVIEESPMASYTVSQISDCIPAEFSFTNTSIPLNDVTYDWSITPDTGYTFINGSGPLSRDVDLQFTVPGDYAVQMVITTPNCGADSFLNIISVLGPPEGSITALSDSCGTVVYYPTAQIDSNNNPLNYVLWDFGPNAIPQTSTQLNPGPVTFLPDTANLQRIISLQVGNSCDTLVLQDTLTLYNAQAVDAGQDTSVCQGTSPICLTASPVGGYWEIGGSTFANYCFDPVQAGSFDLVYAYDTLGCTFYDTITIDVIPFPQVTASNVELCLGDTVQLSATPGGGVFSGNGVFGGNQFTQDTAGVYDITYLYVDNGNGCANPFTFQATVNDLPQVNAGGFITYCVTGSVQNLPAATPGGGLWSGPGLVDPVAGTFNPMAVGVGNYSLLYEYTDANGCYNSDTLDVFVIDVPIVDAGADDTLCLNAGSMVLTGQNSSAPGVWIGAGVTDSVIGSFDPSLAGVGTQTLNYCVGVGDCRVCDTRDIVILALPVVTAVDDSICIGQGPILLDPLGFASGNNVQGIWAGPGVYQQGASYYFDTLAAGTYTLTFSYIDNSSAQACSGSATAEMKVIEGPQASISAPSVACTGIQVDFQSTSTGGMTYNWSFGDPANGSSTLENPSYTYADTGEFVVSLIITSASGCQDTVTHLVDVSFAPQPSFIQSLDTACAQYDILPALDGVEVFFTDQSISENAGYNWNFGGGVLANGQGTFNGANPGPVYFPMGSGDTTYTVQLSLGNSCDTLTFSRTVTVKPLPKSIFAPDFGTFCSPYIPNWANISTGEPDTFLWYVEDFNNLVSTDSLPTNISLTYNGTNDTTYTVIMVAANECGRDTAYQQITVLPSNLDAFFNTSVTQGCAPLTVDFTSFAAAPLSSFDFGDGSSSTMDTVTHTFFQPGTYLVQHLVSNGCSRDTDTVVIMVFAPATLGVSPQETVICPGEPLNFRDTTGAAGSLGYIWSFGNGDSSTLNSPTYIYQNPGQYEVILSAASSQNGCIGRDTASVTVRNFPSPQFTKSVDNGCGPLEVDFLNQTPNLNNVFWTFGDGNVSTDISPTHTFATTGSYRIELRAFDQFGCSGSLVDSVVVFPTPEAAFSMDLEDSCGAPVLVDFQNETTGDVTGYFWNFGLATSTLTNPSQIYPTVGSFPVSLVATSAFGCADTAVQNVTLYPNPDVSLTTDVDLGCGPLEVTLSYQGTNVTNAVLWMGDGTFDPSPAAQTEKVYTTILGDTTYRAYVAGDYQGVCFDTAEVFIQVNAPPRAAFVFDDDSLCGIPSMVEFVNQSSDNEGITRYDWDFGDPDSGPANFSIGTNPSHGYEKEARFDIRLEVTDGDGCKDTTVKPLWVFEQPVAEIVQDKTVGCFPLEVNFSSFQPDRATEWFWTFGNGGTSSAQQASVEYVYPDSFTVLLTVNNQRACFDTASTQVAVGTPPKARFELETFGKCNDSLTVMGLNYSEFADNYLWQFDGWGVTGEENPEIVYKDAAEYGVSLIASNAYGCTDTAYDQVTYLGALAGFSYEQEAICTPSTVTFTDESQDATNWEWDFGDGTPPVFEQNPVHVYTEAGLYQVRQIVTYQDICQDTFYHPTLIEVRQSPKARIGFDQIPPANEGHFQFRDLSTEPGDFIRWEFGDGGISLESNPMHTFQENPSLLCNCSTDDILGLGNPQDDSLYYKVRQIHINENGCSAVDSALIHPNIHGLYIPDAIIPKGQAPDNEFQVRAFGLCKLHIALYNHWGNKVWEWNSENDSNYFDEQGRPVGGWDGKLKGLDIERNVFIWRIHDVKFTGCKPYKGPTQGTLTVIN
ncbi:MAG: PKD domain-containing protein [Bacteroidota bacterium]